MIISTGVSGLSLFESAFHCSPCCLIVTRRLAGTELMIAVVGLMTQFRHLNHILNINDPFTLSQAECDLKPFSCSFIGGHTVLRLRRQSTQEKFNRSSLHCNNSGGNKHQLVMLSRLFTFGPVLLVSERRPAAQYRPTATTDGHSSCQAFNNRKMRNVTSRPAVTSALSLAKQSQNT